MHRYHLVPALRGFGWMGTNWAEIGHSKMKKNVQIWLISALWEDIINACAEHAEWLNFIENKGKSIGKGPNLLTNKLKERRQMRNFADSIIDALKQGRLDADLEKHNNLDRYFVGSASAKHRVPRTFSDRNPTQKATDNVKKPGNVGHGRGGSRGRGGSHSRGCDSG